MDVLLNSLLWFVFAAHKTFAYSTHFESLKLPVREARQSLWVELSEMAILEYCDLLK